MSAYNKQTYRNINKINKNLLISISSLLTLFNHISNDKTVRVQASHESNLKNVLVTGANSCETLRYLLLYSMSYNL
jgi:hypothetical protein